MRKIFMIGVGALALSASPGMAQTPYEQGGPNYYGPPDYTIPHRPQRGTVGSSFGNPGIYNTRPLAPYEMLPNGMTPDVTVSPAPSDRATVPGNLDAGGDGSESNPNSIQPGASKAGGGGG